MPHILILYTPEIEAETDMTDLCRTLARVLPTVNDEHGQAVFPIGGIRVMAYPAAHHAVADASGDHAFCWINMRMGRGRGAAVHQAAGQALTEAAKAHFAPLLARRPLGLTLQIDEGPEVFDAKFGNLHALFNTNNKA